MLLESLEASPRQAAERLSEIAGLRRRTRRSLGTPWFPLVCFGALTMLSQVNDHLGSMELARIATIQTETGKTWWPLTITFEDDESVELQARGDVRSFVSAFQHARSGGEGVV